MAQGARKSLAGSAAAAAKKVIGRRSKAKPAAEESTAAKKAPAAKTAPAKKAPAKKAPAAKSAPVKKAPAKKAPAKKAPAKKAPAAKTAPAKKTPAKKLAAGSDKTTAKKSTPTKKAGPVKKAPVKNASAGSLKVKDGEEAWTAKELDEVLEDLHGHRERLVAIMEAQEAELTGLMKDAGDGAGQDQADLGATSFERDHELTLMNSEREMVEQIDRALARIDDGTYGVCESCGEPIGKMRVMAFPRATLCLTCKQREERR